MRSGEVDRARRYHRDENAHDKNPVFLYCRDRFERPNPFRPDVAVDISAVYQQKIDALDALTSQFYEWLPWTSGTLGDVPDGAAERKAWLARTRSRAIPPEVRDALTKWYGATQAAAATHAEAFEVCEYGSQPDDARLRQLFPMLPE